MALFGKKKNQIDLTVPEMSCGHCEARITSLLGALPEVREVRADSKTRIATLILKGDVRPSAESIAAALADSGYSAELKS